jgi:hypothetical protein
MVSQHESIDLLSIDRCRALRTSTAVAGFLGMLKRTMRFAGDLRRNQIVSSFPLIIG